MTHGISADELQSLALEVLRRGVIERGRATDWRERRHRREEAARDVKE